MATNLIAKMHEKLKFACLKKNGEIAFDYMERFVQQLRAFLKLSNLTNVNLSKDEENALAQLSGSLN